MTAERIVSDHGLSVADVADGVCKVLYMHTHARARATRGTLKRASVPSVNRELVAFMPLNRCPSILAFGSHLGKYRGVG